jgi:hypothetical protein
MRSILKVLKGSTWKFAWNGLKYHAYEFVVDSLENFGFGELDAQVELILSISEG